MRDFTDSLTLVFVADERFAMPLAVSVATALQRLRDVASVHLVLFDGALSDGSKARIERVARTSTPESVELTLEWVEMQREWLPDLEHYVFRNTNFNETVFYRYAIPKVVSESCHRVVYLDSDVIVKENLIVFQNAIPDDASVLAIRDYSIPTYGARFSGKAVGDWLPYEHDQPYFNSGVLGINVDYWRRHNVHERACDTLSQHPDTCRWPGQDPLNFALRGTWREADLAWNLQTGGPDRMRRVGGSEVEFLGEPYEEIRKRAKIIHFTGNKPWDQGFTNPDRPAFVEALRASGWFSPLEFRLWQARWWANLACRSAPKAMGHVRGRLRRLAPRHGDSTTVSGGVE